MSPSYDESGDVPVGSIEMLDLASNRWIHVTDFPHERRGVSVVAVIIRFNSNKCLQ
jgi:hypothetical protein